MPKVVTVELLDKEGGINVATKEDVAKLTEYLEKLPLRVTRKFWPILVLKQYREVESPDDFVARVEKEVKKWNSLIEQQEAAEKVRVQKSSYVR